VPTVAIIAQNRFLSSGPEDCEPLVEPEDFGKRGVEVEREDSGKGGVGVEVESEYDLELGIGGNAGRRGMGHSSLLTVQTVRWWDGRRRRRASKAALTMNLDAMNLDAMVADVRS
jgi:hypothetical protein